MTTRRPTQPVCFDAKGPTFRDAIYPEYKAQRSPMPDDLRSQISPIHEVVRLSGWPVLDVPGVEADDVIGTLAVVAASQGIEVLISSGDKDLAQLVNEHITIIDTMSGKLRDLAGVEAEFGVPARLMLDYQMLVGDQVDNVPGVQGVGPKTAVKLLQEYGSVDAPDRAGRPDQGRCGREAAQGAGLAAHRPPAADHQDRLRPERLWCPICRRWTPVRMGLPQKEPLRTFYETYGFKGPGQGTGRWRCASAHRRSGRHQRPLLRARRGPRRASATSPTTPS